jgi:hypothetical protein
MMELRERDELSLLHLALGLLHGCAFCRRKHVVGVDHRFSLDHNGIAALRDRDEIAFSHVEVIENFAWDNHLATLPHASDPDFRCDVGHASSLSDWQKVFARTEPREEEGVTVPVPQT